MRFRFRLTLHCPGFNAFFCSTVSMALPIDRTCDLEKLLLLRSEKNKKKVFFGSDSLETSDAFSDAADALAARMREMGTFLMQSRRKYCDFSVRGMDDGERDEVDRAVGDFLSAAMAQVDTLKMDAPSGRASSALRAHRLGVVAILNDRLQELGSRANDLRAARVRRAMGASSRPNVQIDARTALVVAREVRSRQLDGNAAGPDSASTPADPALVQMFAAENASLVAELIDTRERVHQAERAVAEIATLNSVFSTKVLEQAKEIEHLYDVAVGAASYLDYGNKELRDMQSKGHRLQYMAASIFFAFALFLIARELKLHYLAAVIVFAIAIVFIAVLQFLFSYRKLFRFL